MRFLPSSSSASSSTSTPDTQFSGSRYHTAGCFPGVLRQMLCFHGLPSYPFDHHHVSKQSHSNQESGEFNELPYDYKPHGDLGIVAKLMGLDSMPQRIHSSHDSKGKGNSVTRSRSMSSIDNWNELELMQGNHSRVNSTLSLHEAPTFIELGNEEFFILSFEGGGKDKELQLKTRKSRKSSAEFKEERAGRWKNKYVSSEENRQLPILQSVDCDKDLGVVWEVFKQSDSRQSCETDHDGRVRSRKKKKNNFTPLEKVETECDSENSSPISVLDFVEFSGHQQLPLSGKEDSKSKSSIPRKKLTEDLEICQNASSPSPSKTNISKTDAGETNKSNKRSRKNNFLIQNFGEAWGEVCKLAERDIMDSSSRINKQRWKGEDFEEIGVGFELEILDQLILELVDLFIPT